MPRPSKRLRAEDLDWDKQYQEDELEKKCEEALSTASQFQPRNGLSANHLLAWSLLQCDLATWSKITHIVKEVGVLGNEFVEKVVVKALMGHCQLDNLVVVAKTLTQIYRELPDQKLSDFAVLAPPVSSCLSCKEELKSGQIHFSQVKLYGLMGKIKDAILLRIYCRKCNGSHTSWSADIGKQGPTAGERIYYGWNSTKFVEANKRTFMTKELCEFFSTLMSHTWTSAQGFSEAFSEAMHNFAKWANTSDFSDDNDLERRTLGKAFYEYEIWNNLRENGVDRRVLNRKEYFSNEQFKSKGVYDHKETPECAKLGCKYVWIADGNWKLQYPLCLYQLLRPGPAPGIKIPMNCTEQPCPGQAFCSEHKIDMASKGWKTDRRGFISQCATRVGREKATLAMLTDVIEQQDTHERKVNEAKSSETVPTFDKEELDEALMESENEDDEEGDDDSNSSVVTRLRSTGRTKKSKEDVEAMQAVQKVLEEEGKMRVEHTLHAKVMRTVDVNAKKGKASCYKNTGGKRNMHNWTRGQFLIVAPCGHIYRWQPLYGSESPSQAFLIMVDHLCHVLKNVPESEWDKCSMVYDNICHVDDMRVARKELPTTSPVGDALYPEPFNRIWLKINKAIDRLHIRNHKDKRCHRKYNPENIQKCIGEDTGIEVNTMRAEETFVWLSRFKKILCAMPKTHHHFLLHRLITRRNAYTFWRRMMGKPVVLPRIPKEFRNQ